MVDTRIGRPSHLLAALVLAALTAAPAAAWEVRPDAPEADFHAFHRHFSSAAYNYPRHGAAPLGVTGFRLFADLAVDRDFDNQPFAATVLDGDLPGDTLAVARVGARKGLPGGFDLGASWGRAVDGDVDLVSGELGWAILDGGLVSPSLGLRLTGTHSLGGGAYELRQYGAEVLVSKGFTVLTPYAGAGVYYSEGTLDRGGGVVIDSDHSRGFVYAGLTLNLLLPRLTFEVEQGEDLHASVQVAFGF